MTCSWCEERFERFLDDELVPAERARLLDHVGACAGCAAMFEELRVVDALLAGVHAVEPGPDFTVDTMADIRALPAPKAPPAAWPAFLVCYVVAAWALIAAAFVLDARAVRILGAAAIAAGQTVLVAVGGMLHVATHLGDRGELSSWTTVAGGIVIVDLALIAAVAFGLRFAAPRLGGRQRS